MKTTLYRNFAVTACALGLLGLLTGCLEMSVSFESTKPDASTSTEETPTSETGLASVAEPTRAISATASEVSHQANTSAKPDHQAEPATVLAYRLESDSKSKVPGLLRMSNQTNQPVRLALLARQSATKSNAADKAKKYDIPAHWDFAPQEGGEKGLLLSLPQGKLKLEKGDILVAFAQDGSRRYWGPYVVGETPSPAWNAQSQEWQLALTP
jgi:predicted component of type VI protein secretion system